MDVLEPRPVTSLWSEHSKTEYTNFHSTDRKYLYQANVTLNAADYEMDNWMLKKRLVWGVLEEFKLIVPKKTKSYFFFVYNPFSE